MMQLVIVFCVLTGAGHEVCDDIRPQLVDPAGNVCRGGIEAMTLAVPWVADHPGWYFKRAYCEDDDGREDQPR